MWIIAVKRNVVLCGSGEVWEGFVCASDSLTAADRRVAEDIPLCSRRRSRRSLGR